MTHPQLRRLKIHRYEQFVDVPWIEFSPHQNLILGINGAGKTSLLRLIHAVLTFDYRKLLAQDFDVEFELAYPAFAPLTEMVEVSGRVLRTAQVLTDDALRHPESMDDLNQLEADMEARSGAHRLNFAVLREQATLALDGKDLPVSRKPTQGRVLPWEDARARGGPTMLALLPSFSGFFVRESDDDFRALTDNIEFSLAPDSAKRFGIEDARDVPPMFLLALLRHLTDLKDKKTGARFGRDDLLPDMPHGKPANSFERLLAPLGSQSLSIRPKVVQETADVLECRGLEIRLKFDSGAEYGDSGLTFGQRRFLMMGLLLLFRPNFPVLIDEIDNGLHPRLVEAVLALLPGRQAFLASHNKIVVDYVNYDSAEDICRKIHLCRRADDGKQNVATLDESTAQEVFEKISIGIMHPSDVLLFEGIW